MTVVEPIGRRVGAVDRGCEVESWGLFKVVCNKVDEVELGHLSCI